MTGNLYAITDTSVRSITKGMPLYPNEVEVTEVPNTVWENIRIAEYKEIRRLALRATDWTQSEDAPLTAAQKEEIAIWRQAMRDLPSMPGFPDCEWPKLKGILDGVSSNEGIIEPLGD